MFQLSFLFSKLEQGSEAEKTLYQDMTVVQFVNRLVQNRPIVFFTKSDAWTLRIHFVY